MNHAGRCTDNTVTTWCRKSYSGSGVCHIMVPMHTSSHTRGVNLSRTCSLKQNCAGIEGFRII